VLVGGGYVVRQEPQEIFDTSAYELSISQAAAKIQPLKACNAHLNSYSIQLL
jgi:hypothetical protein